MMRGRVLCWMLALLVLGVAAWGAVSVPAATVQAAALTVNGAPSQVPAGWVATGPVVAVRGALGAMDAKAKVTAGPGGQITLQRAKVVVQVTLKAMQMSVDGKIVALATPAVAFQGTTYVPEAVLQALFPDYQVSLAYDAAAKAVALTYKLKPAQTIYTKTQTVVATAPPAGAGCENTSGATGVATQEFGKAGTKVEIIALLPITHGCHVRTEAELKKAYQAHPDEIHLTIVDLFGPDAPKYQPKVGGGFRAVVSINGQTTFQYAGRTVTIEKPEGMSYQVTDIGPIIENVIKSK